MVEGIIAVVGGLIALFMYRFFGQKRVSTEQVKLQAEVKKIEEKDAELQRKSTDIQTDEKSKVEEITNEQNRDINTNDLVDFFDKRKGK